MGRFEEGKTASIVPTIQQLRPWHRSMARMMVAGQRPKDLCAVFGLTPTAVTAITTSPLFKAHLNYLEAQADYSAVDVRSELELRQGVALETIDEALLNKENDIKFRTSTALEILDRTGYGKQSEPQRHLHVHAHKHVKDLPDEELEKEAMDLLR